MLSSQWITHSQFIDKLNSQQKSSKKTTSFLFAAFGSSSNSERSNSKKNRRLGGGGGSRNKDRSPDENFTTIQCNTKRTNSVLIDNFLNPVDTTPANEQHEANHKEPAPHPERSKRSIFSGNMKKKIGPMEQQDNHKDKESFKNNSSTKSNHSNSNDIKISDISSIHNYSSSDTKKNSISSLDSSSNNKLLLVDQLKNNLILAGGADDSSFSDEMLGDFIMLPTSTHDLTHLHPMEIEARRILLNLGINSDMLIRSIPNGPRSDIIGAYRIVVNRLQRQMMLLRQAEIIAQEEINKPKTNRTCAIL